MNPDQLMAKLDSDFKADLAELSKLTPAELAEVQQAAWEKYKSLTDVLDSFLRYLKEGSDSMRVKEVMCAKAVQVLPVQDVADLLVMACLRLVDEERGFAQ